MQPTRSQILRLYKDLLRYGEMLVLTDKKYYKRRIQSEFRKTEEAGEKNIEFLYESYFISEGESTAGEKENSLKMLCRFGISKVNSFHKVFLPLLSPNRGKVIDKSNIPVLNEKDLEEKFVRGGGPGGQKVNKGNNCVYLIHKPTGLSVKVHQSRSQEQNRKIARQKITMLLDNMINKENSVENQKKEILREKSQKKLHKQRKLTELKSKWKELISEYT